MSRHNRSFTQGFMFMIYTWTTVSPTQNHYPFSFVIGRKNPLKLRKEKKDSTMFGRSYETQKKKKKKNF